MKANFPILALAAVLAFWCFTSSHGSSPTTIVGQWECVYEYRAMFPGINPPIRGWESPKTYRVTTLELEESEFRVRIEPHPKQSSYGSGRVAEYSGQYSTTDSLLVFIENETGAIQTMKYVLENDRLVLGIVVEKPQSGWPIVPASIFLFGSFGKVSGTFDRVE